MPPAASLPGPMLIGAHVSPAGGPAHAIERGVERGCRAIQIFNQSPRQWKPTVYDDEKVAAVALPEPVEAAKVLGERIDEVFTALHQGANLPAHGASSVCGWCEMRGICRRDWFE